MALSTAVYNLIRSDATLLSVYGTDIYPSIIPKKVTLPAITYHFTDIIPSETKDFTTKWDAANCVITIYSYNYTDNEAHARLVRAELDRYSGTIGGETIKTINYNGESDDVAESNSVGATGEGTAIYMRVMNFKITYRL